MKRTARKWRSALPWTALLCFVLGSAMAIYTYCYETDQFRAVFSFFVQPGGAYADKAPLEAARMLARDCDALLNTASFRAAVLSRCETDGRCRMAARGVDGTHVVELEATGGDAAMVQTLANAAGDELLARAAGVLHAENAAELERASLPETPYAPNRPLRILWTVLGAFAAGSLLGCIFGSPRKPLGAGPDVQRELAVPFLGAVLECRADVRRFLRKSKKSLDAGMLSGYMNRLVRENVRSAALLLRLAARACRSNTAVVTGVRTGEGKNAFVALLAMELAQQGFRVLLADMESENPSLGSMLGLRGRADLFDYLSGGATLGETVVATQAAGLCFIDNRHAELSISGIAATERFASFLRSASDNFDFVLLCAAPAAACADAALLGSMAGVTMLAAADGRYTVEELNTLAAQLERAVNCLAGVVFTGTPMRRMRRYAALGESDVDGGGPEAC